MRACQRSVWWVRIVLIVLTSSLAMVGHAGPGAAATDPPFAKGEVFVGVGFGRINRYAQDGTLIATLEKGPGITYDAGMDFDAAGNLYAANYQAGIGATKFDHTGMLLGPFGSGYTLPESIVVDDAGNVYVGQDDGALLKFDSSGTLLASFTPESPPGGNDQSWIDLAPDQCTLYYTSGRPVVKRFDVCTGLQLGDFAVLRDGFTHNVRIRPNGEVLVAQSGKVYRLDSSGFLLRTYAVPGSTLNLGLDLDPDGASFWTTDWYTGVTAKVSIATGATLRSFVAAPGQDFGRFGLAVFGDTRAATGAIAGTAYADVALPANALEGAELRACAVVGGVCSSWVRTTALGRYLIPGLQPGEYLVTVAPPTGRPLVAASFTAAVEAGRETATDVILQSARLVPPSVTLDPTTVYINGVPRVRAGTSRYLTYLGCVGATEIHATLTIVSPTRDWIIEGEVFPQSLGTPLGTHYVIGFQIPADAEGSGHISIEEHCPIGVVFESMDVSVYIDPSGVVVSTTGGPIAGATTTLVRADSPDGPFTVVPDGSTVMSPNNRANPDATSPDGRFGWDVIEGYYKVRVQKAGCGAPGNHAQQYVETEVLTIPPPVTDLELVLECDDKTAPATSATATSGGDTYAFGSWTNGPVTLALAAVDAGGSGVSTTLIAIDNPGCTPATPETCFRYPGPFALSAEGIHTVTYFSRDAHGNVESARTVSIKIDRTAPSATLFHDPASGEIVIDSRDALSGPAGATSTVLQRRGAEQRLRTVASDAAGNTLEIEWRHWRVGRTAQNVQVERVGGVTAATNALSVAAGGGKLVQHAVLGRGSTALSVLARYGGANTQITRLQGRSTTRETRPGLAVIRLVASRTGLAIEY